MSFILWILLAARLAIALQLTGVSIRKKLPNLMWLAGFYYVTCIGDVFFTIFPMYWLFGLGIGLGEIAMVLFIHQTFYRDRKSPYLVFGAIAVLFTFVDVYFPMTSPRFPFYSPFNWIWLIVVGTQAYRQIAPEKTIDDWIKSRYRLVTYYSALALVAPIQSLILIIYYLFPSEVSFIYNHPLFAAYNYFVVGVTILVVALEYLAWVMPQAFMHFLNRNYRGPAIDDLRIQELSEEEIMRQLHAN
jgi:hypothetical protein